MSYLYEDLIADFNVDVKTTFQLNYKEYKPILKDKLLMHKTAIQEITEFIFDEFMSGMKEFKGSRQLQEMPVGYKFPVNTKEWDNAVTVLQKDLMRASKLKNSLKALDRFKIKIGNLPKIAKDHPVELALDMLEAGEAGTYGTTFDGQFLFDETHDYSLAAGDQSNLLTGTGTGVQNLKDDVLAVQSAFAGYYYRQGGTTNGKRRRLNDMGLNAMKLLIICPHQLLGAFNDLKKTSLITNTTNTVKDTFDVLPRHFTDPNDWYAVLDDGAQQKPFIYTEEESPKTDFPNANSDLLRNHRRLDYGVYGIYNVAYGSFWKIIKTTNVNP